MSVLKHRLVTGSLVLAGVVGMVAVPSASAVTSNGIVRATIGSAITIDSVTPATLTLNITPVSGGAQSTDTVAVAVSTNSGNGYDLSVNTNAATNTMVFGANSIAASGNITWGSAAALANNTWGFAIPSGTSGLIAASGFDASYTATTNLTTNASKFMAMPTNASPLLVRSVTSGPVSASSTPFWYSAKADTTKPNGNYDATVVYTAVARP